MRPQTFLNIAIAVVAVFAVSCNCKTKPDVTTAATGTQKGKGAKKELVLPAPSKNYTVLGEIEGLKSFAVKYDENLYRGGEPLSEKGFVNLKGMGIKTIVSIVPSESAKKQAKELGLQLIDLPFGKKLGVPKEGLKKFLAVFDTKKTPVYVHCHGGTHRASMLAVAYRVYKCGWDWDKALLEHSYLGGSLKDEQAMIKSIKAIR